MTLSDLFYYSKAYIYAACYEDIFFLQLKHVLIGFKFLPFIYLTNHDQF